MRTLNGQTKKNHTLRGALKSSVSLKPNPNLSLEYHEHILPEKYPQIKELFGVDPTFKWKILALVLIQFMMLFVIRDQSLWVTFLLAYCFGGVINHALMLGKTSNFYFNLDISFKSMFQVSMKSLTAQVLE